MTSTRRGLTLLEVLLASAILAMLAATYMPVLSSALRALADSQSESDGQSQLRRFDLGRLADSFLRDPASHGCNDLANDTQNGQFTLTWPKEFGSVKWPAVAVHTLSSDIAGDHRWLVFEFGGTAVVRYLAAQTKGTNTAMMCKGLTLLEMLLAFALLSAIVAATTAWTQVAAELTSPTGRIEHQRSIGAINEVLDLIQQDLQTSDFLPPPPPVAHGQKHIKNPRVTVKDDLLSIDTRTSGIGATRHEYRFDAVKNQLLLFEFNGSAQRSQLLLDHVKTWDCYVELDHHCFDVIIEDIDGTTLARRYGLL